MNDETRRRILARRSAFAAAALAVSASNTACPRPCLEPPPVSTDAAAPLPTPCLSAPPHVCLEMMPPQDDDAGAPSADAGADAAKGADAGKHVTLAPMDIVPDSGAHFPSPPPLVCLSKRR